MRIPSPQLDVDPFEAVQALLERHLSHGSLPVPELPEIALRIVESRELADAHELAEVIRSDRALTLYVLRISASASSRPSLPIVSLQHAVAWLGLDEVANMAFTLALQSQMLDVRGHQRLARRLWRHSLASALWSRQIALMLGRETGLCYLCGLLHDIGKAVTLRAARDLAALSAHELSSLQYCRLLEKFHRAVAACVVLRWRLPEPIVAVATRWEAAPALVHARFECSIVDVAHRLADATADGLVPRLEDLPIDTASFRHLGLSGPQVSALLESAAPIVGELDRYLAP